MAVSYLAPAGASGYDAVGMEYADAAEVSDCNEGPPALTAECDAGSTITFDTSEFVRGDKSVKCLMTGAADTAPYSKLSLDLSAGTWDSATYEASFWLKVGADCPKDKGLVLLRFGNNTPSLGLRKVTNNTTQFVVNNGTPTGTQANAATNGIYPVLVPDRWHYVRVSVTGFAADAQSLTFNVWLDGVALAWSGTKAALTGFPDYIEIGCVRSVDALGEGATATVWIDDLRIACGEDVTPDKVSATTCLPIITGQGTAVVSVGANVSSTAVLEYGSASGVYTGTATSAAGTWHRLPVTLPSGTCYYRVTLTNAADGDDVTVLPEQSFTMSHSATSAFTIGVISDTQHFVTRGQCGYYLAQKAPDIVLAPGDITAVQDVGHAAWDPLTEQARQQVVSASACIVESAAAGAAGVIVALGNHDYVGSSSDPPYSTDWIRSTLGLAGDSIFDYGNARIITLEDMGAWPTSQLTAARLSWLADALKNTNAAWKIVHGHYAPFYWQVANEAANPKYTSRAALAAVLEAGGCNLFVGAHYHSFNLWSDGGVCYLMNSTTTSEQGGVENGYYNAADGALTPRADSTRRSIYKGGYTTLDVGAHSIGITFYSRDDDSVIYYRKLRQRTGGKH
jgi:hypothetical protein